MILRNVDDVVQQRRRDRRSRLEVTRQTRRPVGYAKQVPEIVRGVGLQPLLDLAEHAREHGIRVRGTGDEGRGMGDGSRWLEMGDGELELRDARTAHRT